MSRKESIQWSNATLDYMAKQKEFLSMFWSSQSAIKKKTSYSQFGTNSLKRHIRQHRFKKESKKRSKSLLRNFQFKAPKAKPTRNTNIRRGTTVAQFHAQVTNPLAKLFEKETNIDETKYNRRKSCECSECGGLTGFQQSKQCVTLSPRMRPQVIRTQIISVSTPQVFSLHGQVSSKDLDEHVQAQMTESQINKREIKRQKSNIFQSRQTRNVFIQQNMTHSSVMKQSTNKIFKREIKGSVDYSWFYEQSRRLTERSDRILQKAESQQFRRGTTPNPDLPHNRTAQQSLKRTVMSHQSCRPSPYATMLRIQKSMSLARKNSVQKRIQSQNGPRSYLNP